MSRNMSHAFRLSLVTVLSAFATHAWAITSYETDSSPAPSFVVASLVIVGFVALWRQYDHENTRAARLSHENDDLQQRLQSATQRASSAEQRCETLLANASALTKVVRDHLDGLTTEEQFFADAPPLVTDESWPKPLVYFKTPPR